MNDRRFYVYEHWRPDKDECFYVGKGGGRRAWFLERENRYHRNIVSKLRRLGLCVEVRLVQGGLTEAEAFALEISRIKFWRDYGVSITNLNDGGEGNANPSEEIRKKISSSIKLRYLLCPDLKMQISEKNRSRKISEETRAKMKARPPRVWTEEDRVKFSALKKGIKLSEQGRKNIAEAMKNRKSCGPLSEEHKRKISEAKKGKLSEESRRRIGDAQRGKVVSQETLMKIEATRQANQAKKRMLVTDMTEKEGA